MNRLAARVSFAVLAFASSASAYEYRCRWVERVGETDIVIGGDGATLDARSNTGSRRLRLEMGVFDDASGPAPAGGLLGWANGTIRVSGPAANSQDRRTPGRISPFTYWTAPASNGDPLPAGGLAGPDADDFDFQALYDINATMIVQYLSWPCDANGKPVPQPPAVIHGRNTFVAVYEITTDPADSTGQNYTIAITGDALGATQWRVGPNPLPPDCDQGVPGYILYIPFSTAFSSISCTLNILACDAAAFSITDQPDDVTAPQGGTARFAAATDASQSISYQWRRGDQDLVDGGSFSGAATSELTVHNVSLADHGMTFSCAISDGCNTLVSAAATLSVCGDPQWLPLGDGMNPGGAVYALAVLPNGDIVAGGSFTVAGGVPASRVARWDGLSWSPLGTGMNGDVYALAVLSNGDLVAGGAFTIAGGVSANRVARWTGVSWQPFPASGGNGMDGTVFALSTRPNSTFFAGGSFMRAGVAPYHRLAFWNGLSWTQTFGVNAAIRAFAPLPSAELIVAGDFTLDDGRTLNRIARLSGTWLPYGTGMNNTVRAVARLSTGDVVAGGDFTTAGGAAAQSLARWSGTQWTTFDRAGMNGSVRAIISLEGSDFIAAGDFTIAGEIPASRVVRRSADTWRPLGTGMDAPVHALTRLPNGDIIAGGTFSLAGGVQVRGIARWPTLVQPAVLVSHPQDAAICVGGAAAFVVTAHGGAPLSYQWRRGSVDLVDQPGHIAGAASATLTITNAVPADAGSGADGYTCIVTNGCNAASSNPAAMTVGGICPADFNCNAFTDSQDLFDFITAFFSLQPSADFNRDTFIDTRDVFDFIESFFVTC